MYFFDAKIFKVPLNQPHEIYVDILNNKIIFNKEIVKMKLDGVFKQNKIEMYFLKDIFSQDVSDNKNCYIDSNYSNILEHLFIEADIDLKWSETYGAFWFKKVTDWILKENELWNHYRETNKRKGVNKFWQKYEK
ncbi:hypothetical protein NPX79_03600 [Spiroplasma endosymbiont of Anurida maritima]|uniref:hypothetical protein n=1 Tax=Spiroplasma endosymbiont of Anurida maritima TaxID=2967972 RepID=UPI0036D2929A